MVSMIIAADYNRPWNLGDDCYGIESSASLVYVTSYQAIYSPTTFAGLYIQLPDSPRFADATRLINFGGSRVHKGRKA